MVLAFSAHGLQRGEPFGRGVGPVALVLVQRDLLLARRAGRLVGDHHFGLDRDDLLVELPPCWAAAVRRWLSSAEFVLRLAGDLVARGDDLGRVDHRHIELGFRGQDRLVAIAEAVGVLVLHEADRIRPRPRTAIGTPSRMMARAAIAIACRPEAHWRSIVVPATLTGKPARMTVWRAKFPPVVPCCKAQPTTTSSISPGSTLARRAACWMRVRRERRPGGIVEGAPIGFADRRSGGRDDDGAAHDHLPSLLLRSLKLLPSRASRASSFAGVKRGP